MSSENTAAAKLLRRFPAVNRIAGRAAALTLVLAGISQALGRAKEVRDQLFELLGIQNLQFLHYTMTVVVVTLIGGGFFFLWLWVFKRYISRWSARQKWGSGAAAAIALLLASFSIYATLPVLPSVHASLLESSRNWKAELLALNSVGGGLRTSRIDTSADRQVWTTAQAATAMLAFPADLGADDGRRIRALIDFFEQEPIRLKGNEGWGYMEWVDWGVTEIAGWVALAYAYSLKETAGALVWGDDLNQGRDRLRRVTRMLVERQMSNGSWAPVNQTDNPSHARTYSTVVALWSLLEARRVLSSWPQDHDRAIENSIRWLLTVYNAELRSWVPNPLRGSQLERFPGLNAQVLYVLGLAQLNFRFVTQGDVTYERARSDFWDNSVSKGGASQAHVRPVSQNDRTHDSDRYLSRSRFMVEGSTFLWYPWAFAYCTQALSALEEAKDRSATIERSCTSIEARVNELTRFAKQDPFTYVMAESLLAINMYLAKDASSARSRNAGR